MIKTLLTYCHQNIGQMSEKRADIHIDRLNKQTGKVWRKDYADYLYTIDETEEEVDNPCKRSENCVWVTCVSNDIRNYQYSKLPILE